MRLVYDIDEMLDQYHREPKPHNGRLVTVQGIDGQDAYNPSAAIPDGAHPYVYARVEPRDDEFSSWSIPFRQMTQARWEIEPDLLMLRLQDPFITVVHGTLVVGGVRIVGKVRDRVIFRTVFLRGNSPAELEEFAYSPLYMKDVRLIGFIDGRVGVFTRPLGGTAGRGRIAYTEIGSLDELTTATMAEAPMLDTQPIPDHWWGVNEVHHLSEDMVGVLAHVAKFAGTDRHYYPVVFTFDRRRRTIVHGPRIIADRECFPPHPPKRADLVDVIFPSSLDRDKGLLTGGLSDSAIGVLDVTDPFARWS